MYRAQIAEKLSSITWHEFQRCMDLFLNLFSTEIYKSNMQQKK